MPIHYGGAVKRYFPKSFENNTVDILYYRTMKILSVNYLGGKTFLLYSVIQPRIKMEFQSCI